ncbi:MAG: HAMP domain-containing histidine kinase [Alistipes sp.]|jgi:signal transduction histidine kinase|nr:HAMP domain-containing histidine kinase [Alistipes sp.]
MKLIHRILGRLSVALLILMAVWAVAFYAILTAEINDETDDTLEDYAHDLITRVLAGETLPSEDNGTNNTYHLAEVTGTDAAQRPAVSYSDETMWMASKMETEPARVLRTVFDDSEDRTWELTVAIPSFEKQDLQSRILLWIALLYALMLATVVWVNVWIVRRSFRPLYTLLDWLGRVRPGAEVPPLEMRGDVTEFRLLGEAVVDSVRRSGEMFDEQRLFTGNAAHELQTPIAVCRGRLEMLAGDPSLTELQLEQIGSVMGTLDRLAALNRTLLLLARIDNRGFSGGVPVDATPILSRLAEDYSEVYGHRAITVEVNARATFRPVMDETLAGMLWGNLLKNAFVHSPDGGRVDVTISARGVAISNTATEGPLDPVVIFRRFYRGNAHGGLAGADQAGGSLGRETGTGLGLALVDSICRLYGLNIDYDYTDGRHTFTIKPPKA